MARYTNYPNGITSGGLVVGGPQTAVALAASGGAALNPATDLTALYTITPTASETLTASSAPVGYIVVLKVVTSGTSTYTLTFGTGFVTTGTLATGTSDAKTFTLTFVGDGTNLVELARTTAM